MSRSNLNEESAGFEREAEANLQLLFSKAIKLCTQESPNTSNPHFVEKSSEPASAPTPLMVFPAIHDPEEVEDPTEATYGDFDIIKMLEEAPMAGKRAFSTRIKPHNQARKPLSFTLPPDLYPDQPRYSSRVTDFVFGEMLGEGNFTQIFAAEEKATGIHWAVKVAEKRRLLQMHKEDELKVEKYCLNKLKGVQGVVQIKETFQDFNNLYLVMELLRGRELWDHCKIFGVPSKSLQRYYFAQLISIISEIHQRHIVHRDLKPENVMVCGEGHLVKIFDFGASKDTETGMQGRGNTSSGRNFFRHFVGTAQFMAPECLHNRGSSPASDVYSLGCLYYNLAVGFPPFVGDSDYLVFKAAEELQPIFYPGLFEPFEEKLILDCLMKDPTARPTANVLQQLMTKVSSQNFEKARLQTLPWEQQFEELIEEIKASSPANVNEKDWLKELQRRVPDFPLQRIPLFTRQIRHLLGVESFSHSKA